MAHQKSGNVHHCSAESALPRSTPEIERGKVRRRAAVIQCLNVFNTYVLTDPSMNPANNTKIQEIIPLS